MPLFDQLRHGVDVTKFKADQVLRINRIQNEIGDLRREILGAREKISDIVLQLHKQSTLTYPQLEELCFAIDQTELRIAEKDSQIAAIRIETPPQASSSPTSAPVIQPPTLITPSEPENPCPHCQFDAPVGAMFCPSCGQAIPQQLSNQPISVAKIQELGKCADCGFTLPASATFCPECGKPVAPSNPTSE